MDLGTVKQKMDSREYRTAQEFAGDVRLIFTNCYKYNPPDHDVVTMARKLQEVFELRIAKIPDEPLNRLGQMKNANANADAESSSSGSSSESSSETEDTDEERRAKQLKLMEQELIAMQEKMRKLAEESGRKKKIKKKKKEKKKGAPVNSGLGKPGGHSAMMKNSSLVTDSIGDSIASVAMGAGDVKLPGQVHQAPAKGGLMPGAAQAANKAAKTKGIYIKAVVCNFLSCFVFVLKAVFTQKKITLSMKVKSIEYRTRLAFFKRISLGFGLYCVYLQFDFRKNSLISFLES